MPIALTAWAWFGVTGTFPVLIWWWRQRPAASDQAWRIPLDAVRAARLGPWRTCAAFRDRPPLEIFHDEIAPADLARLRRALKDQLAAG